MNLQRKLYLKIGIIFKKNEAFECCDTGVYWVDRKNKEMRRQAANTENCVNGTLNETQDLKILLKVVVEQQRKP